MPVLHMLQPALTCVVPESDYTLLLTYDSGEQRRFDAKPYISGSWYGELSDEAYFRSVCLLPGGTGIAWPHGQDVAPHELYELSTPIAAAS